MSYQIDRNLCTFVLMSVRGAGINDRDIECIQFKRLSDDARDVHITFSSAAVCALFSRPESLRVNEKSYYIQSSFRRITYVAVFDAPHELPDEPIVQRLQDRFQYSVVNTRRNKHQGTDLQCYYEKRPSCYYALWPFCDPFSLQWCGEKM